MPATLGLPAHVRLAVAGRRHAGRGAWLTKELPRSTRELLQAQGVGLPGRILKD